MHVTPLRPSRRHGAKLTPQPKSPRGWTLVEALCVTAVGAILIGLAASGMNEWILRRHMESTASEIQTALQLARSTAASRNQTTRFTLLPATTNTYILVHTGTKDACEVESSGALKCEPDTEVIHNAVHNASTGIRITNPATSMAFSPTHGTVTPTGTIKLIDSKGRGLNHVVNVMGRMRTCSPGKSFFGYPAC